MVLDTILLLDDDPSFRAAVRESVEGLYELVEAASIREFRTVWEPRRFALLLLDMRLRSDREGIDVLRQVFAQDASQPVIMLSAYGDSESAIEAVGAGAMMFLHKQEFSPSHLIRMMEAVIAQGRLRRQLRAWRRHAWDQLADALVGQSAAMREVVNNLRRLAPEANSCPVLLAEPGCGASLVARVLHRAGLGAEEPFLEVGARSITAAGERFFTSVGAGWMEAEQGTLAISRAEYWIGTRGDHAAWCFCYVKRRYCHIRAVSRRPPRPCRAGWRRSMPGPCACPRCGSVGTTSPCWRPISCSANARWAAAAPVCSAGP